MTSQTLMRWMEGDSVAKKNFTDPNALITGTGDGRYYGTVGVALVRSKEFQSLSIGARATYVILRCHAQSQESRRCLHQYGEEEGRTYDPRLFFVFPASHSRLYGLDRGNATRYMKELEKNRFIKCVESNKHRRKVNIYMFSAMFKANDSKASKDESTDKEQTQDPVSENQSGDVSQESGP